MSTTARQISWPGLAAIASVYAVVAIVFSASGFWPASVLGGMVLLNLAIGSARRARPQGVESID